MSPKDSRFLDAKSSKTLLFEVTDKHRPVMAHVYGGGPAMAYDELAAKVMVFQICTLGRHLCPTDSLS